METNTNNALISVVIPIYNIKDYIDDCVSSILRQTYTNLEIFLVDDGSTDGCSFICDNYKLVDERIKVIHKKNGGLSDARNVAIDVCSGEYITFVDGDDIVSDNYIERLYGIMQKTGCEVSVCSHCNFFVKDSIDSTESEFFKVFNVDDAIKQILISGEFTTSAWGKLYATKLFKEIRYPKGKIYEDLPTTWRVFSIANKVVYTPSEDYYYRQNPTSIMNTKFGKKNFDIIDAHKKVISGLEEIKPALVKYAKQRYGTYCTIQLFRALLSGYPHYKELITLRKPIQNNLKYVIQGTYPIRIKVVSVIMSCPGVLELCMGINKLRKA